MKIVEGGLPEDKAWRALVLLSPGEDIGLTWQLGLSLAKANNGELVLATILSEIDGDVLKEARATLGQARKACRPEDPVYTAIVQSKEFRKAANQLTQEADIDLLLASANEPGWRSLDSLSCAVAIVRDEIDLLTQQNEDAPSPPAELPAIRNILVPTSGGPNTAHALEFLLPLTKRDVGITALYIAPERLGENEKALGRSRLRQTLDYVDANEIIESKLISAASVTVGIVNEAKGDFDIVMIGASLESSLDKALFGNIPEAVVRQCHKPVVIVREPSGTVANIFRKISWALKPVRLNLRERTQAYVRIRRDARPDTDYFVLIGLAAAIAALGLLANSAAVVIGAMLVAPLMSPMAGTGLAMVLGEPRFLRLALGATLKGALLALFMGLLVGLIPLKEPMTAEVLARTQPTLLDVVVALLSGMAVAYALGRSEATAALPGVAIAAALVPPLAASGISLANLSYQNFAGALLLFITNFVAISSASALVFLILGFRPTTAQKERRAVRSRSAMIAVTFLIVITLLVAFTTFRLAQTSAAEANIRQIAEIDVTEITDSQLTEINIGDLGADVLQIDLVVRSARSIPHSKVVELQAFIATELQREVAMTLTVIPTTQLDPFLPPTFTPTPTATNTPTAGPTSTVTPRPTDTPSPTHTPTATATQMPTSTSTPTPRPTDTPSLTPSPTFPRALVTYDYGLNLREEPDSGSTLLSYLEPGTEVILLDSLEQGLEGEWQKIQVDDLVGWVLADFLGEVE